MRTRLIRPEYWSDTTMAALPAEVRLTYMGLWCVADDAGFFDWEPVQLAAQLYVHAMPAERTAQVEAHLELLLELTRIRRLECGAHGVVPTLPDYRIKGGEQLYTVKKRHDKRCAPPPGIRKLRSPTESSSSESDSVSESVSVSNTRTRTSEELSAGEQAWQELGASLGARRGH